MQEVRRVSYRKAKYYGRKMIWRAFECKKAQDSEQQIIENLKNKHVEARGGKNYYKRS